MSRLKKNIFYRLKKKSANFPLTIISVYGLIFVYDTQNKLPTARLSRSRLLVFFSPSSCANLAQSWTQEVDDMKTSTQCKQTLFRAKLHEAIRSIVRM